MEIDFHLGVTYVVGRLAGFPHEEAQIIATCAQYVDDTVNSGFIRFDTGQAFNRISSAHEFMDHHLYLSLDERRVWVPFHFLPGNEAEGLGKNDFFNRIVCKPHSPLAIEMAKRCILAKNSPHGLHRLGVTAHVFVDTWAHQGFAGIKHKINRTSKIVLEGEPMRLPAIREMWSMIKKGRFVNLFWRVLHLLISEILNIGFPMGHGTVLHYPDWPFLHWSYKNGHDEPISRDNPTDFLTAADELCKVFQRFRSGDPSANVPGLPVADKAKIDFLLRNTKDEEGMDRLKIWEEKISGGHFSFGEAKIEYAAKGLKSWKYEALGTTWRWDIPFKKFEYNDSFPDSNWKRCHDALMEHQNEIIHGILPSFGIQAI